MKAKFKDCFFDIVNTNLDEWYGGRIDKYDEDYYKWAERECKGKWSYIDDNGGKYLYTYMSTSEVVPGHELEAYYDHFVDGYSSGQEAFDAYKKAHYKPQKSLEEIHAICDKLAEAEFQERQKERAYRGLPVYSTREEEHAAIEAKREAEKKERAEKKAARKAAHEAWLKTDGPKWMARIDKNLLPSHCADERKKAAEDKKAFKNLFWNPTGGRLWTREVILPGTKHKHIMSLWQKIENDYVDGKFEDHMATKFVAVWGRRGLTFPATPTYEIGIDKDHHYYIWEFKWMLPEQMRESLMLLQKAISWVVPGAHPVDYEKEDKKNHWHYTYKYKPAFNPYFGEGEDAHFGEIVMEGKGIIDASLVPVPGYKNPITGKYGTFEKVGDIVPSYRALWDAFAPFLPVKGKSLWKFVDSEKIYVENLPYTTAGFVGLHRFNTLLEAVQSISKKAFKKVKGAFWHLMYCFGKDCGLSIEEIKEKVFAFGWRRGYDVFGDEENLEIPHRKEYYTDPQIVKMLGTWSKKFFPSMRSMHVPMAAIKENAFRDYAKVAALAKEGKTIRQIAEELKMKIGTVKRHRAAAAKAGLCPSRAELLGLSPI